MKDSKQQAGKRSRSVFVEAIEIEGGFIARYAYPGGVNTYVTDKDQPAIFPDHDTAELAAFRAMQEDWNRHLDTRTEAKNYFGIKPRPEQLKELVDDYWLDVTTIATLKATNERRVADWIAGNEEAPFDFHWILHFLKKEGAVEEALSLIRPHLSQSADHRAFRNRMSTFDALRDTIAKAIEEQRELAAAWEIENPGEHRMRHVIELFDEIADPECDQSLNARYKRLEEIAGKLGIAFDVNAEIAKQNEPYYREITRKRIARMGEERKIVKEIDKSRSQRIREEREIAAAKHENENRMRRLGLR